MGVFVIAEIGSTWELDLGKLEKMARGIKECGADAMKLQWTSSGLGLAQRRGLGEDAAAMYYKWLQYDPAMLIEAKEIADRVGLEFMCTAYLIQDIPVIEPLVKRFKVSAYESGWKEFVDAHVRYGRQLIISIRPEDFYKIEMPEIIPSVRLHCISEYPCPIEHLKLPPRVGGLSDHTTSTLTGGFAVMRCAEIVEKHVKGFDTSVANPDAGHSLACWTPLPAKYSAFGQYVDNIRIAERCM